MAESATSLALTVTLGAASERTVTVAYATSDGTATAGADYTAGSGTLTFRPDEALTQTISVPILPDMLDEADETFTVTLSEAVNATVASPAAATVTITDDDALPRVDLPGSVVIVDEDAGALSVAVMLSAPSGREVRVAYASSDVGNPPATAGEDYTAVLGTLTFAPGETRHTIDLQILDDSLDEGIREIFTLTLSDPVNAELGAGVRQVFITDDDAEPTATLSPLTPTVIEGDGVEFTVRLDAASALPVNLTYRTSNGTATAPGDYTATVGTVPLRIPAGELSGTFLVSTTDDALDEEENETFTVRIRTSIQLSPNASVDAGAAEATVTLTDNDAAPGLAVSDVAVQESSGELAFTVRLDAASAKTVTVAYAVSAGTATEGVDYTAVPAGTLKFAPGTTEQTVGVPVLDDKVDEPNETLTLTLSGATDATISDPDGTGTIEDDEEPPVVTLVLSPSTIGENGGASTVTATLSGLSSRAVTVEVSAAPGTGAVAGDFTLSGTTLEIAAGSRTSTGTVTVSAVDNMLDAPDKTVAVTGTVTGGSAEDPQQQLLTIVDDEELTVSVSGSPTVLEGAAATFPVEVTGGTSTAPVQVTYTVTGTANGGDGLHGAGRDADAWMQGSPAARSRSRR